MIYFNEPDITKIYSNEKFEKLEGYLEEGVATTTLMDFLYSNLGLTVFFLTGGEIRLYPYQEIILRSWFDHSFNLNVWSRGGGKTFLVSIFCWLSCIFNKGTKIILSSNVFRSSRRIMTQIERTANHKNAQLLQACFQLDGKK